MTFETSTSCRYARARQALVLLVTCVFSVPFASLAADAAVAPGKGHVSIGVAVDDLSDGLPRWFERHVQAAVRLGPVATVQTGLRTVERFSQSDSEISAGLLLRSNRGLAVALDLATAPDGDILPRQSASLWIGTKLGKGWAGSVGWRQSRYRLGVADLGSATVERYAGALRLAYTLRLGHISGASGTVSHEIRVDRYYSQESVVGLGLVHGEESEYLGDGQYLTSDAASLLLLGEHYFSRSWAMRWRVGYHEQRPYYERLGGEIAVKYRF